MDEELRQYNGGREDTRSEVEKAQDYDHNEVASAAMPAWVGKPKEQRLAFPVRDQDGSSTCMAQAGAKIQGVENKLEEPDQPFIVFSARDIYERRANKPDEGMAGPDLLSICSKYGATTEERLPSQRMSEAQINAPFNRAQEDIVIADKYRAGGYVAIREYDNIDAIADVIVNKHKAVLLMIFAEWNEWMRDVPVIQNFDLKRGYAPIRHGIAAVDAFIENDEKCLLIDDSWGKFQGMNGQRILTESWIKQRVYYAGYLLDLSNKREESKPVPTKPKFKFTKPLSFGMVGKDVVNLQKMLRYEEFFPQKVEFTGKYLQITAKGVKQWQVKHGLMDFAKEKDMRKVRFGPKSIAIANKLYS